jgi:hypothetical protein
VPIQKQGRKQAREEDVVTQGSRDLFSAGKAINLAQVTEQLKRKSCELDLPRPLTTKLSSREICIAARQSHVRVGWSYVCTQCDNWHVNLAGGYFLTTNGIVATCYHVAQPDKDVKDGCLIAVDESGKVFGVAEILAANKYSDSCILRVVGQDADEAAAYGAPLNADLLFFYTIGWDLKDLAEYAVVLHGPHIDSADTRKSLKGLKYCLNLGEHYPGLLD